MAAQCSYFAPLDADIGNPALAMTAPVS